MGFLGDVYVKNVDPGHAKDRLYASVLKRLYENLAARQLRHRGSTVLET
jgi:hypothetical protein